MAKAAVATKARNSALVVVFPVVSMVPVAPVPVRTIISTIVPTIVRHHDATAEQRRHGNQQCEKGFHGVSLILNKCGEAKLASQPTGTLHKAPALEHRCYGLRLRNRPPVRSMGAAYCFFVLSTLAPAASFAAPACASGFATSTLAFALSAPSTFAMPVSPLAAFVLLAL